MNFGKLLIKRSEALQRIGKDKGNVFYSIDSKTGSSIKNISEHSSENEILFKSKTLFNITACNYINFVTYSENYKYICTSSTKN